MRSEDVKLDDSGRRPAVEGKYFCQICSYVYDPAEGDPRGGIPPGTTFEDLPDDWVCPLCEVGKEMFVSEADYA